MNKIEKLIELVFKTSSSYIIQIFTAHLFLFIWLDMLGIKVYPSYFTTVYIAVLAGVSLSNLVKKSKFFRG